MDSLHYTPVYLNGRHIENEDIVRIDEDWYTRDNSTSPLEGRTYITSNGLIVIAFAYRYTLPGCNGVKGDPFGLTSANLYIYTVSDNIVKAIKAMYDDQRMIVNVDRAVRVEIAEDFTSTRFITEVLYDDNDTIDICIELTPSGVSEYFNYGDYVGCIDTYFNDVPANAYTYNYAVKREGDMIVLQ